MTYQYQDPEQNDAKQPCEEVLGRFQYAKGGGGFDFAVSYLHRGQNSLTTFQAPQRLRYAKDGEGLDFSASYILRFGD